MCFKPGAPPPHPGARLQAEELHKAHPPPVKSLAWGGVGWGEEEVSQSTTTPFDNLNTHTSYIIITNIYM